MKTVNIVERIEGEAKLSCTWDNGLINDVSIDFLNFRGFEYILKGKPILDALVYTPRICGICGQAHLKATVEAIEDIYKNAGHKLKITKKAKLLREIGLNIEIIDSHLKWFYMFIMPDVIKLANKPLNEYEPIKGKRWVEASKTASETIKALAVIGGQWPHTSYMVPGGVVCDPTHLEIITMINYLDGALKFCKEHVVGMEIDDYLKLEYSSIDKLSGDLKYFYDLCKETSIDTIGTGHDRFISLGGSSYFKSAKLNSRVYTKLDPLKISEDTSKTFDLNNMNDKTKTTWSKSVTYNDKFYETGSLARSMINNKPLIKSLHKVYKDSMLTRVFARMDELIQLLVHTKKLLKEVDLNEESFIEPEVSLKTLSSKNELSGLAMVEACRGSLFHDIKVKDGLITSYNIITPTVWNLGPSNNKEFSVSKKALVGLDSIEKAKIVLRSFDVCSVCTTH